LWINKNQIANVAEPILATFITIKIVASCRITEGTIHQPHLAVFFRGASVTLTTKMANIKSVVVGQLLLPIHS
jgi:hypothetical protein